MSQSTRDPFSRRDLGARAALVATLGVVCPFIGLAQESGAGEAFPRDEQAEIDAKFDSIMRKYSNRLNTEQRTRIREILERHERMLHRVRAFPLENSDAAATGLRLYPTDTLRKKE